ncbi:MAG: BlaI/MecI/CopY family transcriptional regulator [Rikenellaceae bacterium]|nr:BlaI/MecI/CopY family transcriptional regulator [Rikenellaceae bacterium]
MQLTKAEEQIMRILWTMEEGSVQDILQHFSENKPARTTVATVLNILESKNFVVHRTEGRVNLYKATVSKEKYSKTQLTGLLKNYFNGSISSLVSFFAKENNLSIEEMDIIMEESKEILKDKNE